MHPKKLPGSKRAKVPKVRMPKVHKAGGSPKGGKLHMPKGGKQGAHGQAAARPARPPAPIGLPVPNTTCDLYVGPNSPPGVPDQAAVACHLDPDWRLGAQNSQAVANDRWTHVMYVANNVDIRDLYPNAPGGNLACIPNLNGTAFVVVFVETVNRSKAPYKRIFLKRNAPAWPTNEL